MYPYRLHYDSNSDMTYTAEERDAQDRNVPPGTNRPGPSRPPGQNRPQRPDRPGQRPDRPDQRPPGQRPDRPDQNRPPYPGRPQAPWGRPGGYPPSGPPTYIPEPPVVAGPGLRAVDPGAIRGCLNQFTYIWLRNGMAFWMYITYLGRQSVSGYRWTRFGWMYSGVDLQSVERFSCVGR